MSTNDLPVDPAAANPASGAATGRTRTRRRAVRPGGGDSTPSRIVDDADVGWHETAGDRSNDDQLRRDVPPHW